MPAYFAKKKWRNPQRNNHGPFQHAHGRVHSWGWLAKRPEIFKGLQDYTLYQYLYSQPKWTDPGFYPVHERLIHGLSLDGDKSALVDVGGGSGLCLDTFSKDVPEWKGRLVLQERESMTKHIRMKLDRLNPRIQVMTHNFFEPQPIKGARAYHLRSILRDFPDEQCRDILRQLKNAMTHWYSRILIDENVIADSNPSWEHTSIDFYRMALSALQVRTESQWRNLIGSVGGLRVMEIWRKGDGNQSIIEVMRSDVS